MKTIANLLLVAILLASAFAASARNVEMNIDGLACEGCSARIAKRLQALPAVNAVSIDLPNHLISVQLKDGANVSDFRLTEVVASAGYDVTAIQRVDTPLFKAPPPAPIDAEKVWLQRLVYLLGAALVLVIALPWLKRVAANARMAKLDSTPPDAS